jgi:hypothetical protein
MQSITANQFVILKVRKSELKLTSLWKIFFIEQSGEILPKP